jgi:dUTPase
MMNNNTIKIKRLREEAQLPTYGSELASGFDVRAYDCVVWDINKKELVPVKIAESNGGSL